MSDDTPVVKKFVISPIENEWKSGVSYTTGDYIMHDDAFFIAKENHTSGETFAHNNTVEKDETKLWEEVDGIPHQLSWEVSTANFIEINSLKPENPFFHQYYPSETESVVGSKISLLAENVSAEDFRIKIRSEAAFVEGLNQ
jgi:hypothetical protein